MTLDELLLEWSYRSERGYPSVDNPSDVSTLKQILKEINLSEQDIDDVLDNLPDKVGGDDLAHQGTDGMEDSSVEAEKEKQYQDKFDKETKKQSEEEQDLISIVDDNQEPILNLSSEELERLSQKINAADELNEDFDGDQIENTEEGLIQQIKDAKLSPEVLKRMSAELLGDKLGPEIKEYFGKGGKALLQNEVFGVAFSKMKETSDIIEFVKYIKNPMSFREAYPNDVGNLMTPFENTFSSDFLSTLLRMDKGYSGISVGKGEYFLTLLCSDVSFDSSYKIEGDLAWGNKGMEVKNAGAKPTGQKAEYGPNSHDAMFTNILRFIKNSSDNPTFKVKGKEIPISKFSNMKKWRKSIKGRWPYKIATLYGLLSPENKKPFIDLVDKEFKNAYKGLPNNNELELSNFIEDGNINASKFELGWSRSVVKDYQQAHNFDFILFLNAAKDKGGYELMLSDKINNSLGLKGSGSPIEIYAQDGLPRWTASSVK